MAESERIGRPLDRSKDKAIFSAAHDLLFSQGPAGFSIEAVARLAKVSKVTIYSRYANREELVEAVIRSQADRMAESLSIVPSSRKNVRSALIDFGINLLTFLLSEEHQHFMRALGSTHELSDNVLKNIYRNGPQTTINQLANWMSNAHKTEWANFNEPQRNAELLLGMLMGVNLVRSLYGEPCQYHSQNIEQHVSWVIDTFLTLYEVR